jgi:prepilin-type N-terminal cleavage/methylation domain-containing protein/prepilin-type processing-associated H-X9-DG protein
MMRGPILLQGPVALFSGWPFRGRHALSRLWVPPFHSAPPEKYQGDGPEPFILFWNHSDGFSLIELLATILIIVILVTLLWGANSGGRQKALKSVCQKNLQKIYVGLEGYANDHSSQFPAPAAARTSEEALDVLVPRYTSDTGSFICPGSKDPALPPAKSFRKLTISYAYYMGCSATNGAQAVMSDRQVDTQAKASGEPAFSTDGKPPGNNHDKYGGNFLFCDGHTEASPVHIPFSLRIGPGQVLLNP